MIVFTGQHLPHPTFQPYLAHFGGITQESTGHTDRTLAYMSDSDLPIFLPQSDALIRQHGRCIENQTMDASVPHALQSLVILEVGSGQLWGSGLWSEEPEPSQQE
mmetsp:Transcript_71680/g.126196  ORF Transcript_71680/g.126196 Transcript_71680/m.126196 type:complete len:105 (+) Transcript_71680:4341-4655(+)